MLYSAVSRHVISARYHVIVARHHVISAQHHVLSVGGHVIFSRLVVPSPLPDVSAPQFPALFDLPSAELVAVSLLLHKH